MISENFSGSSLAMLISTCFVSFSMYLRRVLREMDVNLLYFRVNSFSTNENGNKSIQIQSIQPFKLSPVRVNDGLGWKNVDTGACEWLSYSGCWLFKWFIKLVQPKPFFCNNFLPHLHFHSFSSNAVKYLCTICSLFRGMMLMDDSQNKVNFASTATKIQ